MKFSGVTILQGVEFSIFPIDFEWALQQCSATALPVIFSQFEVNNEQRYSFCVICANFKLWVKYNLIEITISRQKFRKFPRKSLKIAFEIFKNLTNF